MTFHCRCNMRWRAVLTRLSRICPALESLELYYCTNGSATASSPVRLPRLSSVTIYRWTWSNKDVVLHYVSRDRDPILFKDFSKSDSQIQQSSAQNWALLLLLTFSSIVRNFSRWSMKIRLGYTWGAWNERRRRRNTDEWAHLPKTTVRCFTFQ